MKFAVPLAEGVLWIHFGHCQEFAIVHTEAGEIKRFVVMDLENKRIIIAIAIGYPDWDFPANNIVSSRESLDINTRWIGF